MVQNHAIRRWRSYLPRRYFDPLPDETWTEECPCGTKLPCDLHATLWVQVRYLKPSDPDYIAALTRHGISVYVPKPEELHVPSQSASQESPGREAFHCVPNIEPNGEELLCDTQAND